MNNTQNKYIIKYFSGTGNTHRVGQVFKHYLENKEYEVSLIDVSKSSTNLRDYDLYILGSPTYSKVSISKVSEFFDKYIDCDENKNKDFMTYVTYSWSEVYGHITLKNHLNNKGYKVSSASRFLMPNGFYMMSNKETSEVETKKIYEDVVKKIEDIMNDYFNNELYIEETSKLKRTISEQMYKILNKTWIPSFAKKNIQVQEDKCILCKACVNNCPSKNIDIVDNKIVFDNHCLACAKCLNIGPKNAFLANKKEFKQYKIKQKPILEQI